MDINSSYQRALFVGLVAFLVLVTVSGAITTFAAQTFVVYLRVLAGVVLSCSVVVALFMLGLKKTQLYALYIYVFIVCYGALLSALMGTTATGFENIGRDVAVGVLGVMVIAAFEGDEETSKLLVRVYCIYATVVLFSTVWLGGLSLSFPPSFRLEYIAASHGAAEEQTYSLGVSSFFGFAAVAAALLASYESNKLVSVFGLILAILFVLLSMLGGGRGESLAALALVALVFARRRRLAVGVAAATVGFYYLGTDLISLSESDFLFLRRFSILFEGDLSSRDVLLRQGFQLLRDNPQCQFLGCGLGYFQSYYQYDFGRYPHNVLMEAVISYGVPMVLVGLIFCICGFLHHVRKTASLDVMLFFFGYALIISLKSGYFLGSWLVLVFVCYFSAVAIDSYMRKYR